MLLVIHFKDIVNIVTALFVPDEQIFYLTLKQKKHKSAAGSVRIHSHEKSKINFGPPCHKTAHAEASLAMFISAHCSILPIDHLTEICKLQFPGKPADNLQLHRTKCTAIVNNVLAPFFLYDLKNDIGDSKFSRLIDESTDISVTKYLGITIIYYSSSLKRIVTTFFSLEKLTECNAESIVESVKLSLNKYNLNIKNLIGLGTDNASVMVGVNKGVHELLKRLNPYIILVRCVCHSIQLATSHACSETLPRHLDFLVSETYNWFFKSTLRQQSYQNLFKVLNDNQTPFKIVRACNTRWLSIETAVSRIIDQWSELKLHFDMARSKEKCYTAEMLYNIYNDEQNLAFFLFLRPILCDIQRINKLFKSNNIDQTKLANEVCTLIQFLAKFIVVPSFNFNPITRSDFTNHLHPKPHLGYSFENKVSQLIKTNKLSKDNEKVLRDRCIKFNILLIKELQQRLPDNIDIFKKIEILSPSNTLKQHKDEISPLCELFGYPDNEIEKIDSQWKKISIITWNDFNTSATSFWAEVNNFKDASNTNPFKELSNFALTVLSCPWSNAEVERVFSSMNIIKSKARNKMGTLLLTSLLQIRSGLKRHNKCCHNFKLPSEVVKHIGTNSIYKNSQDNQDNINNDNDSLTDSYYTDVFDEFYSI